MIEVVRAGNRWTYRMICAAGRVLVYTDERWDTDREAFNAGKAYRSAFWASASLIDHRMGANF